MPRDRRASLAASPQQHGPLVAQSTLVFSAARALFAADGGQPLDAEAVAANKEARELQQQQQQGRRLSGEGGGEDLASVQAKAAKHVRQSRDLLSKSQLGDTSGLRPAPPKEPASARARGMASARGANSAGPRGRRKSAENISVRPQTAPRPTPMKSTPSGLLRR